MASRAQPAARGVARFLAKPRSKPAAKNAAPAVSAVADATAAEPGKAAPSLKIPELLTELEELFKQLGVRLTYEALGGELGSGGLCKVKGQFRIIIDRRTTPGERVAMLLPLLLRFEIAALPKSATLRDLLQRLRPAADPAEAEASADLDAPPAVDSNQPAGEVDAAAAVEVSDVADHASHASEGGVMEIDPNVASHDAPPSILGLGAPSAVPDDAAPAGEPDPSPPEGA